jgi:hypothetical protein
MFRCCVKSLTVPAFRFSKFNAPGCFWQFPRAAGSKPWPPETAATGARSGESAIDTNVAERRNFSATHHAAAVRGVFPPLQQAQIVELACLEPIARGLHITHWTSADLARQAALDGIVPSISGRQVRRILNEVELQPHLTRYWKTPRLDEQFLSRAAAVLWCYAHAESLARHGIWVVCVDEMPNLQALERRPIRRAIPGLIERQEFDYIRHGTVNALMFLVVHSGRMRAMCPPVKDAAHYVQCLRRFRDEHRTIKGVYLIQDGDPSHTAAMTSDYLGSQRSWWHPRFTPVHASWLNEAEMLNRAFSRRYLRRESWASRAALIQQIQASWPEYNRLYAHPFEWMWSDYKMRQWYAKHTI